jgi:hypothetical protein
VLIPSPDCRRVRRPVGSYAATVVDTPAIDVDVTLPTPSTVVRTVDPSGNVSTMAPERAS